MATLRHQIRVVPFLALLFVVVLAAPAAFAAEQRATTASASAAQMLDLVNAERANAGLGPLQWRDDVAAIAASWTTQMAATGQLSHNDAYFSDASRAALGAKSRGENVAFSGSIEAAHWALMNSPGHRANILNPAFTDIGIGAVRASDGTMWVTEDFLESSGAPAAAPAAAPEPDPAPAPEPAAEPEPVFSAAETAEPVELPLAPVPAENATPETGAPVTTDSSPTPAAEVAASARPSASNARSSESSLGLVSLVAAVAVALDLTTLSAARRQRATTS
jgi:hypothetical protein